MNSLSGMFPQAKGSNLQLPQEIGRNAKLGNVDA